MSQDDRSSLSQRKLRDRLADDQFLFVILRAHGRAAVLIREILGRRVPERHGSAESLSSPVVDACPGRSPKQPGSHCRPRLERRGPPPNRHEDILREVFGHVSANIAEKPLHKAHDRRVMPIDQNAERTPIASAGGEHQFFVVSFHLWFRVRRA